MDSASKCTQPVFTVLVAHLPLHPPPPRRGKPSSCSALSGFHHLVGLSKIRSIALWTTANISVLDVHRPHTRGTNWTSPTSAREPPTRVEPRPPPCSHTLLQRGGRKSSPIRFDLKGGGLRDL